MTSRSSRRVLGLVVVAVATSATVLAGAWEVKAPFGATINGHKFYELRAANADCVLNVRLRFQAPQDGYKSGASERNYHRFKVRLKLADDITIESPIFGNRSPGKRIYRFQHDSSAKGCWAKQEHKVRDVDIQGCRGRGCAVDPFD